MVRAFSWFVPSHPCGSGSVMTSGVRRPLESLRMSSLMLRAEPAEALFESGEPAIDRRPEVVAIPLFLESAADCAASQPVTIGIPFAKGTLRDPNSLRLSDSVEEIPLQAQVLAHWSDGSVKWLLL